MTNSFKRADSKSATEMNEQNRFETIRKTACRTTQESGHRRQAPAGPPNGR